MQKYKRKHIQTQQWGVDTWVQKRSRGKHDDYALCTHCALNKPNQPEQCRRLIGLGNFSEATKMMVVVWQCPEFEEVE